MSLYRRFGKRALDLSFAAVAICSLAPLLLVVGLAVRLRLGHPVLFRQQRPGQHGRPFVLNKFRTLTDRRSATGELLPDGKRLHPFGSFLRRSSLDELPELWNVLRGEMSLVGPRPLLMAYLDRYTPRQMQRHDVLPGITGWAQIHGRNTVDWSERFELDLWYIEHQSLLLDLKILASTVGQVLGRRGIEAPGHATMPEFRGTREAAQPQSGDSHANR